MSSAAGAPYIRVAGTWIAKDGYLPMTVAVRDGAELKAAALAQLDAGTDFVKIMLDPPDRSDHCPFTVDEVRGACEAVHARGRTITAHATILDGARVGAGRTPCVGGRTAGRRRAGAPRGAGGGHLARRRAAGDRACRPAAAWGSGRPRPRARGPARRSPRPLAGLGGL